MGEYLLIETMDIDLQNIFKCYANDYFPERWQEILEVYIIMTFS